MFYQYISPSMIQYIEWAQIFDKEMESMISYWDGEGGTNGNITEVTVILAHLNKFINKSPQISFSLIQTLQ